MKRYNDLTDKQKERAIDQAMDSFLNYMIDGTLFLMEAEALLLKQCWDDMERLQTPWFIKERVMEESGLKNIIVDYAKADAEKAFYPEVEESIIRINLED
jgi:hypothetical protein